MIKVNIQLNPNEAKNRTTQVIKRIWMYLKRNWAVSRDLCPRK